MHTEIKIHNEEEKRVMKIRPKISSRQKGREKFHKHNSSRFEKFHHTEKYFTRECLDRMGCNPILGTTPSTRHGRQGWNTTRQNVWRNDVYSPFIDVLKIEIHRKHTHTQTLMRKQTNREDYTENSQTHSHTHTERIKY